MVERYLFTSGREVDMSRIGKKPIPIPQGVSVEVKGNLVVVKGPKGELKREFHPEITVEVKDNTIYVKRHSDAKKYRALHGLTRALINNMVIGVTQGFQKVLEIHGMGYRAQLQGQDLNLQLGFSHPVVIKPKPGITFEVQGTNKVIVKGIDKEVVGQQAAEIRALRKPEPYKGAGIRYQGEYVRKKVGKKGV